MAQPCNGLGEDDLRLLEKAKEMEEKLPVGLPNVGQVWTGAEPPFSLSCRRGVLNGELLWSHMLQQFSMGKAQEGHDPWGMHVVG